MLLLFSKLFYYMLAACTTGTDLQLESDVKNMANAYTPAPS